MVSLFIVDDEKTTREGLATSIDWKEIGIDSVKTASNGKNALNLMESIKPDLLLCDIRMPKMDGIELATKIRERYPDCKIIFISGYSDKEYLKSAIHLRAIEYIEKPFDIIVIKTILKKAVDEIEEINIKTTTEKINSERFNDESIIIYQKIMSSMLGIPYNTNDIFRKFGGISVELPLNGIYKCATVLFNWENSDMVDGYKNKQICRRILEKVNYAGESGFASIGGFVDDSTMAAAICCSNEECKTIDNIIFKNLLDDLLHAIGNSCTVTIGCGKQVLHIDELPDSYQSTAYAKISQFYFGVNKVYDHTDFHPTIYTINDDILAKFSDLLLVESSVMSIRFIKDLIHNISLHMDPNTNKIKNLIFRLLLIVQEIAKRRRLIDKPEDIYEKYIWKEIDQLLTLEDLAHLVILSIENLFLPSDQNDFSRKKIRVILGYIANHYTEKNFSIKAIAENVYLSQSYLCAFFKKEKGKTINTYINELKINKAKELLSDSSMKIYEISTYVGISDSNYFCDFFKKYTGYTPTEYRNKVI